MKIVKKILIGIVVLIVLLLIVAIFIPADYTVTRMSTVNRPKQEVFDYVKSLKNQEQYSVWVMEDPKIQVTYTGVDGTVGSSSAWKSEKMGEGSQTITAVSNDKIEVDLNFIKPMADQAKASMIVDAVDANNSNITCTFYGHGAYPIGRLMSLIGKKFVGDAYEQNLVNIKKNLEK
ncbi:SRPBCC family protein [Flavobacterium sp.]|uniref:SRPBCC family protein n=1 Tax=Flavobacterium sp. TaxID=239 RepID=UPI00262ABB28|nr:SRPBCC family protein [Flavobacterium sp.]